MLLLAQIKNGGPKRHFFCPSVFKKRNECEFIFCRKHLFCLLPLTKGKRGSRAFHFVVRRGGPLGCPWPVHKNTDQSPPTGPPPPCSSFSGTKIGARMDKFFFAFSVDDIRLVCLVSQSCSWKLEREDQVSRFKAVIDFCLK